MNLEYIVDKMREYDGRFRFMKVSSRIYGENTWKLVLYSDDCCFRTAKLCREDDLEFEDVIDAYIAGMEEELFDAYIAGMEEELSMRNGDHDERC